MHHPGPSWPSVDANCIAALALRALFDLGGDFLVCSSEALRPHALVDTYATVRRLDDARHRSGLAVVRPRQPELREAVLAIILQHLGICLPVGASSLDELLTERPYLVHLIGRDRDEI